MKKRNAQREMYDSIHSILWNVWDPIGVSGHGPDDEYDCCVPGVLRLLEQGADVEKIADHLQHQAEGHMGLPPGDKEHDRRVARLLRGLVEPNRDEA